MCEFKRCVYKLARAYSDAHGFVEAPTTETISCLYRSTDWPMWLWGVKTSQLLTTAEARLHCILALLKHFAKDFTRSCTVPSSPAWPRSNSTILSWRPFRCFSWLLVSTLHGQLVQHDKGTRKNAYSSFINTSALTLFTIQYHFDEAVKSSSLKVFRLLWK